MREPAGSRARRGAGVALVLALSCAAPDDSGRERGGERSPARDARVESLLARMTVEEKVAQLRCSLKDPEETGVIPEQGIGGLGTFARSLAPKEAAEKANRAQAISRTKTRLGIPILVHDEALHGLVGKGATSFPQAIALAATFDPELVFEVATAIGKEVASRGIHQALSPVVNLARDVRWGRVEETYGEDPHLAARMGVAFCRALEAEGVVTTPKHFAVNVGEGGRDSHAIDTSERFLRETEFVPFEACFREAKSRSVMAAYNSLNGIPCSSHPWLLTDVLRKEWGFSGIVVSDYGSAGGIVTHHRAAATSEEGAALALEAGLDVELPEPNLYGEPLVRAVKSGRVSEATLDRAVRRVLALKFALGLFEKAEVDPARAAALADCDAHRALALRAARESIVLLQNEGEALPFGPEVRSIAVVGPLAETVRLGGYSGTGTRTVSVLEGIRAKAPSGVQVVHAPGCGLSQALPAIDAVFLLAAGGPSYERGLRAEYFANRDLSGEPALVRVDPQVDFDWGSGAPDAALPADGFSVRWTGTLLPAETRARELAVTTDDGVRLWLDGKLLVDRWSDRSPATDRVPVSLVAGGRHELKLEYYENGGGAVARLGWDPGDGLDHLLADAIYAANESDAIAVVVGIEEGEGRDRSSLDLPDAEERLVLAMADLGKPTAVVLVGGSAITMECWRRRVPAILHMWYGGEEGGAAVAEVLFGETSPAGRLPISWPISVGQVPLTYDRRPSGRGYDYHDLSGDPLFAFGHGLSFTQFDYANLSVAPKEIRPDGSVEIRVDVKNAGDRAGDEVVQLYLRDEVGSVVRPLRQLKRFARISLEPGETKPLAFRLGPDDLALHDARMRRIVEPGEFRVMVGASSRDIRLEDSFTVAPAR